MMTKSEAELRYLTSEAARIAVNNINARTDEGREEKERKQMAENKKEEKELKDRLAKQLIDQATQEWVDEGKIIEAGWTAFCLVCIPPEAADFQRKAMRDAFFAGAQHLWASILTVLEPDAEPTTKDLKRMDLIHAELEAWKKVLNEEAEAARKRKKEREG